ncbi:MAG: hypothetical protein IH588_12410 [Anaerolineales bacterium]|nr:hypothetical protein [Anaerolineales bacterium]
MTIASASIIFGIAFIAILTLLHFLKPELSPIWRSTFQKLEKALETVNP